MQASAASVTLRCRRPSGGVAVMGMESGIRYRGDSAEMIRDGRAVARLGVGDVTAVWELRQDPLVHEDEPVHVVASPQALWLIPYPTAGAGAFLRAIAARPEVPFQAGVMSRLPFAWRVRLLGILPAFPTPRLAARPVGEMPKLENARRVASEAVVEKYEGQEGMNA